MKEKEGDMETGRGEADIGREELDDAEGKEEAVEKAIMASEGRQP